MYCTVDPDIYFFNPCSSIVYAGPFLGLRSREYSRFSGFAGLGWLFSLDAEDRILALDYMDYESKLDGGIRPYAGVDYRVLSSWRGAALHALFQYTFVPGTAGEADLGLDVAF